MVTLEEFMHAVQELELCCNVGNPSGSDDVIQLKSWREALDACCSREWIDFLVEREKDFSRLGPLGRMLDSNPKMKADFDRNLKVTCDAIYPLIARKTASLALPPDDRDIVAQFVPRHLVGAAMFILYQNDTNGDFELLTAGWILSGYFPCRWEGDYPNGKLVIY
jgi:hypothetical protein